MLILRFLGIHAFSEHSVFDNITDHNAKISFVKNCNPQTSQQLGLVGPSSKYKLLVKKFYYGVQNTS